MNTETIIASGIIIFGILVGLIFILRTKAKNKKQKINLKTFGKVEVNDEDYDEDYDDTPLPEEKKPLINYIIAGLILLAVGGFVFYIAFNTIEGITEQINLTSNQNTNMVSNVTNGIEEVELSPVEPILIIFIWAIMIIPIFILFKFTRQSGLV